MLGCYLGINEYVRSDVFTIPRWRHKIWIHGNGMLIYQNSLYAISKVLSIDFLCYRILELIRSI
jgi:hypothetical protein